MEEKEKPSRKRSRLRLRSLNGMLAQSIAELTDLANDPEQSPAKRANAVLAKADILRAMYVSQAEERKVAVKAGLEKAESKPTPEPEVKAVETLEEKLKRRGIC